jgi:hypothetical protein
MGGSGGGGSYRDWPVASLAKLVRADVDKSAAEYEPQLAGLLSELLANYNSRDAQLARTRLDQAKEALQDSVDASLDQFMGGSVAKHTYVDGLSDIDSLVIVNGSKFEELVPAKILGRMEGVLREQIGDEAEITHGAMAITITYPDKMIIQLLPAIRTEDGLKVPAVKHSGWSEINPEAFQAELTKRNEQCGGKLVPTIKLAKAVIANFPEKYRLSGYHVESLAIAAFRSYTETKTTAAMLPVLFEKAKELVLSPIRDRTGQSVHVDEYLGDTNSPERQSVSHLLNRVAKRMRNASAAQSNPQWQDLFFNED